MFLVKDISYWDYCHENGIIAMGYRLEDDEGNLEPVVGDCSKLSIGEYNRLWHERYPNNGTRQTSLKRFAYDMKIGDIVYIKDNGIVVGKGKITSGYKFDPRGKVVGPDYPEERAWEHYREVEWFDDFEPLNAKYLDVNRDRATVAQLSFDDIKAFEEIENQWFSISFFLLESKTH